MYRTLYLFSSTAPCAFLLFVEASFSMKTDAHAVRRKIVSLCASLFNPFVIWPECSRLFYNRSTRDTVRGSIEAIILTYTTEKIFLMIYNWPAVPEKYFRTYPRSLLPRKNMPGRVNYMYHLKQIHGQHIVDLYYLNSSFLREQKIISIWRSRKI